MKHLDNLESLLRAVSHPNTFLFYVFNKEKEEYRFLDKYTVGQFIPISSVWGDNVLFDRYDIYEIESEEEYRKLLYIRELVE